MDKTSKKQPQRIERLTFPRNERSRAIPRAGDGPASYYGPTQNSCTCVCSCW